jgi:DNA-directed RNA polymerase specialized sigma24 family protein
MSVPEVASELSVPHETVRSRLRLALAKLRAQPLERGGSS